MFLVSYDISNDKLRTKFAKFLTKYGFRVQMSVFKLKNSGRILDIVAEEVKSKFSKKFEECDSVYIFKICEGCEKKALKFGFARFEDQDIIYL